MSVPRSARRSVPTRLEEEVASGAYDADWNVPEHPKLYKLLDALRDEWERIHRLHLIHGDFYTEVQRLGDGCVDLILTDPPYKLRVTTPLCWKGVGPFPRTSATGTNTATRSFLQCFPIWAHEWARLLRPQGSGYVFSSDRFLSHLRSALEGGGLHVKATIVWHKTNPGTQMVKTNFKSSVEYVLFFVKGDPHAL